MGNMRSLQVPEQGGDVIQAVLKEDKQGSLRWAQLDRDLKGRAKGPEVTTNCGNRRKERLRERRPRFESAESKAPHNAASRPGRTLGKCHRRGQETGLGPGELKRQLIFPNGNVHKPRRVGLELVFILRAIPLYFL